MSLSVHREASSNQLPQCNGSFETASSNTVNASVFRFNFLSTTPYLNQNGKTNEQLNNKETIE
jgi:hypothetical protein